MHFGSSKGIFNDRELRDKAREMIKETEKNLIASFHFLEDKSTILKEWFQLAQEEFALIFGKVLEPSLNKIMLFFDKLIDEI